MNERIAAIAKREGRKNEVTIRHVEPEPRRRTGKKRPGGVRIGSRRDIDSDYPGWTPDARECRREGCDNTFLPNMPSQAYCSTECRDEATRAQRRRTDKGHRERRAKRVEESRGGPRTRTCALPSCDREFEPPYPRSLYCSPEHADEARLASRRRYRQSTLSHETRKVMAEIERLDRELHGRLPELARDYLVLLWQKVNKDPACPPHVYDRLERLLGIPAADRTTIADDAG